MGGWDDADSVLWFFIIGAALSLYASVTAFARSLYRDEKWQRADGRVVDVQYRLGHRSKSHFPTVCFQSKSGAVHTFVGLGSNPSQYVVGHSVKVLYDPADPDQAIIADWANLWLFGWMFLGAGLGFAFIALVQWWVL